MGKLWNNLITVQKQICGLWISKENLIAIHLKAGCLYIQYTNPGNLKAE